MVEFLCIAAVYASRPAVVGSGMRNSQGGYYIFKVEFFNHLLKYALVSCKLKLAACNVRFSGLEAENLFRVFFITDANVNILHKICHNALSFFACPKLLSEVQVA